MLEAYYLHFCEENYPHGVVFQQDNSLAHLENYFRQFFITEGFLDMSWPAKSPDLNCIKECMGEQNSPFWAVASQFDTIEDLKEASFYEWDILDVN